MQNNIDTATNEPAIGGVYLRLFVANPAWALRRPKEFLSDLMDTTLTLMAKEKADVCMVKNVLNYPEKTRNYKFLLSFLARHARIDNSSFSESLASSAKPGGPSTFVRSHTTFMPANGKPK